MKKISFGNLEIGIPTEKWFRLAPYKNKWIYFHCNKFPETYKFDPRCGIEPGKKSLQIQLILFKKIYFWYIKDWPFSEDNHDAKILRKYVKILEKYDQQETNKRNI